MSKLFAMFGTNKEAERTGVWINYGDVKFLVARAGGANLRYAEVLKKRLKPIQHQVDRGTLSKDEDDRVSAEIFAEGSVRDVQCLKNPDVPDSWVQDVPAEDGTILPYTTANVVTLLLALPEMANDLRLQARDANKYLTVQEDEDVKNS